MKNETQSKKGWFGTTTGRVITIGALVAAIGAIFTGIRAANDAIDNVATAYVVTVASKVADELDSIRCVKRLPIDSLILSELKTIRKEQRRNAYFSEKTMPKSVYNKVEAEWRRDSLWNAMHPDPDR
jgi:hypothetical protein